MGSWYPHTGLMKQLTLRLSDDLHAKLKALAEHEHRSLHGEVLHLIEQAVRKRSDSLDEST